MIRKKLILLLAIAAFLAVTASVHAAPALGWWFGQIGTANANFFTVGWLNRPVAIWLPNGTLPYAATQYTYTYVNYTTLAEVTPSLQGILNRLLANATGRYVYNQLKVTPYVLFLQTPYAGDIGTTALYFNAKTGSTSLLSYTPDARPPQSGSSVSGNLAGTVGTWSFVGVSKYTSLSGSGYIYGYLPAVPASLIAGVNVSLNLYYATCTVSTTTYYWSQAAAVDVVFRNAAGSLYAFRYVFQTANAPALPSPPFTYAATYTYTIVSGVTASNTYILLRNVTSDILANGLNPASLMLYALVFYNANTNTDSGSCFWNTVNYYLYNFIVYVKPTVTAPVSTPYAIVTVTPTLLVDTSPVTTYIKGVYNMSAQPSSYAKPFTLTLSSGQTYTAPRMIYVPQSLSNWLSQYTYAVANTTDFPFPKTPVTLSATPSQAYVLSNALTGYIPTGISYQFNVPVTFVAFNGSTIANAPSSLTIYNTKFTLTPSSGRAYLGASIAVNLTGFLNWLNQFTYAVANTTNFPFPNIDLTSLSKITLTVTSSSGVNTTYTFASAPSLWLNPGNPRFYLNVSQVTCVESGANKITSTILTLAGGCQYGFFGYAPGTYTLLCPSNTQNIAFYKNDYVGTFFGIEVLDPYGRVIGRSLFASDGSAVFRLVPNGQYTVKLYSPSEQRTWGTIVVAQSSYTIVIMPRGNVQIPNPPVSAVMYPNGTLYVESWPRQTPATITVYKRLLNGTRVRLATYTCGASYCRWTLNLGSDPTIEATYSDAAGTFTYIAGSDIPNIAGAATPLERNMTLLLTRWVQSLGVDPFKFAAVMIGVLTALALSVPGEAGWGLVAGGIVTSFFAWRFGVMDISIWTTTSMMILVGALVIALERYRKS